MRGARQGVVIGPERFLKKRRASELQRPTGPDVISALAAEDRSPLLIGLALLLGATTAMSVVTISLQPHAHPDELIFFAIAAGGFGLIALSLRVRRIEYLQAAWSAVALVAAVLLERILTLFLSGYFDDPSRSMFMPVFAFLPLLYLVSMALLRDHHALEASIALWVAFSSLVTALSAPYWSETPPRSSLIGLLSFIWFGHAVFIAAFAAVARDLRRAFRQLGGSEARFRSLFDLAAVGINVTDESGRYLMVNRRMADMLGYTQDELCGLNFRDVTLPEDVDGNVHMTQQLVARRLERFRAEKRYRSKGGRIVHAEIFVCELECQPDGQRRFICVALDITERRRAEDAAAEHRRIRDFHFDNTPVGVVEFDPDLRIRRWSKRAEKIFGWTEAEVVGRTAEAVGVIPPDQVAARAERLHRMFEGGQDRLSALVPMFHRSGRRLWIELHNSIARDAQGQPSTLISMSLDVTESQDMLRMLNESEARFRSIFNQAAVGIALLDAEGRWLNVNHKLCEITGYSMDELMQVSFQSITHPDDLDRDLHMAAAVMDCTIDHYSMEKRYIRKDGSLVWVLLFVRRLDATPDSPARFVSVVEDIDERKAAESRVRALTASLESRVAERTAQLRDIIRTGQRRNEELTLITEMGRLLSAATEMSEAAMVVTRYLPRIFPLADGALYLGDSSHELFDRKTHWGEGKPGLQMFQRGECWALRRGESHHVEGEPDALHCMHVHGGSRTHPHLCMPIQSLGSPLGLIELAWGRTSEGWAPEIPLIRSVAEKIGLAFGNLRLREELSRQALLDPLTGLNNRRWLETALRMRVARHSRTGEGFAVLMIDVDHFKSVNDLYGHEAGDRALQEIGAALLRSVREGEAAARFGGEEFTVLLDTAGKMDAQGAAERIRLAITAIRVRIKERDLPPLTISIGVAMYPDDGDDPQRVLERADEALYEAKRKGRNQVQVAGAAALTHQP